MNSFRRAAALVAATASLMVPAAAQAATTTAVSVSPTGGNVDLVTTTQIDANATGTPLGDAATVAQALPSEFVNQLRFFGNCPVAKFDTNGGPTASNCPDRSSIIGTGSLVLNGTASGDVTSDRAFIVKSSSTRISLWWHFTNSSGVQTNGVARGTVTQGSGAFGPTVSYDFTGVPSGLRVKRLVLSYLRGSAGLAPFAGATCAAGHWSFQVRVAYEGGTAPQVADASVACGTPTAAPQPSKLELARATIFRSDRVIDIYAPITSRASGNIAFDLQAAGEHYRWSSPVDSDNSRVRVRKGIPAAQANLGTGILTMSYPGDADTRPQVVRLRAASNPARLEANRPTIENGHLRASGTISSSAHGVVRVQLEYFAGGKTTTLEHSARIADGRWSLDVPLTAEQQTAIAQRSGTVHSYILFTGYFARRMRGEMESYQVLGEP